MEIKDVKDLWVLFCKFKYVEFFFNRTEKLRRHFIFYKPCEIIEFYGENYWARFKIFKKMLKNSWLNFYFKTKRFQQKCIFTHQKLSKYSNFSKYISLNQLQVFSLFIFHAKKKNKTKKILKIIMGLLANPVNDFSFIHLFTRWHYFTLHSLFLLIRLSKALKCYNHFDDGRNGKESDVSDSTEMKI